MGHRKTATHIIFLALALAGGPGIAHASFDEFADDHAPARFQLRSGDLTLTLKGEVELELHDLEGQGGVGYDSPTDTRTLGTRSPFVEIDSFWLALRLGLPGRLAINSLLEFSQRGSRVGAVWFDARANWPGRIEHHLEIGLHTPLIKLDRRTERYPLIATVYWRDPEYHAVYEGRLSLGIRSGVDLGLSLAVMRPIAFSSVQESTSHKGTINIVAYGPARPFSGNAPVWGGRLRLFSHGAFISAFGFIGSLAAEAGTDELRNSFASYQDLPGYNAADVGRQDPTFWWSGGRLGYDGYGVHAIVEFIASRESLLRRWGLYGQLSYALRLRDASKLLHTLELLGRYERYRLHNSADVLLGGRSLRSPAPSQAVTWDFDVITAALITTIYRDMLRLRLEYTWIHEHNGVPGLGIPEAPIRNNELLAQLELRF
ncbi:MAG: hypothetical protein JRH20_26535 [Deltaproteobacteria bacterium]|nr:hypothetical protein [Deltaproteobacteria bacterium]